jgi:DNA topoisomerase-1
MKDATGMRVIVGISVGTARFRASGRTISFPGYLRAYVEGADDPEAELADKEKILPPLKVGQRIDICEISTHGHETQPPARYSEGTLIKQLEALGIGRPSTWATIVDVVMQRTYAFKKGTALVPTFLALALSKLMSRYFANVVDYEYTANLEEDLDKISRGEADNLLYLTDFYSGGRPGLAGLVRRGEEIIDPREVCGISLGTCLDGRSIEVRIGRYGPFLTDGETRASLPNELPPDELNLDRAKSLLEEAKRGPESLGIHPSSGKAVYLKVGRFGPYVQEGEVVAGEQEKPKMASLLAGMKPESVTLDIAVKLLSLPKTIGLFPDNGAQIEVHNGRYGPYVKAGSVTRTITGVGDLSPLSITQEQAIELLRAPKIRGRNAGGATSTTQLRNLGLHPETKKDLIVKQGRFGPYVTDGVINASLPRGTTPEELSIGEAISLLDARAAKIASEEVIPRSRKSSGRAKSKRSPKTK